MILTGKKFSETIDLGMSLSQLAFCLSGMIKGLEYKSLRQLFWRIIWRGRNGKRMAENIVVPKG